MSLKPWREVAQPHKDVLEGTFKQSEFAADISQVANGTATEDYQDAEKFFARTFITEGMRLLLMSVAQRLAGQGGDPVIQLQTAFGGGKTHTMLAVFHLASRKVTTDKLAGIPPLLDAANISALPQAKVAVIDGINLSPSHPNKHGNVVAHTLWGELAWQLLGEEGYQLVAASDVDGTSPGKDVLIELITRAAPCVILIDELVAFIRQLEIGKQYSAGTFDSNISFIQALTEALKAVPNAILLASLPESEAEVGGTMGQRALNSLEKYFARVESVWKPVSTDEAFEIVRRRLFESAGERALVEGISRQFSDYYRANADKFPTETQSNVYYERLCASYPIHPEVFDRLYEDWSTLDKFQRTRGVLQYMAVVINELWKSGNTDAMIMPGSLPLQEPKVNAISIRYLPTGWDPVIEKEIDGAQSLPVDIDNRDPRFGSLQAARRITRTIFLGTAPGDSAQKVRGVKSETILLGVAQPGQVLGTYDDALRRLRDAGTYLYGENDRYWFDTKPNLRREMESRKQSINERDELQPLLKTRVSNVFGRNSQFAGIHVFTPSVDVPDDYGTGPRLVVLPTNAAYTRGETNQAYPAAENILRNRGDQPRQKQNRLIFLAPDFDVVSRLKEQGRIFLAWKSIVIDIENGVLVQDLAHLNQAKRNRDSADQSLTQLVRETFKWLIAPHEEMVKSRPELRWEAMAISPAAPNLIQEIENRLREEEWLIFEWSPIHLRNMLNQWYLREGKENESALRVWQDSCNYLYLPRLVNDTVFRNAITQGVATDEYFAFAAGKDGDRYLGFAFGRSSISALDNDSLLIDREAAIAYREKIKPAPIDPPIDPVPPIGKPGEPQTLPKNPDPAPVVGAPKKNFYATVKLDPVKAKGSFAEIMDEVVLQFSSKMGVEVKISVEIEAVSKVGFDESLQRSVKENCRVLKFVSSEFEE
jgi:predicted AAA+ superfamily ATPase